MSQLKHDVVRWGRALIRYDYSFSQRKTLAISVHPDLRVEVVAPQQTPIEAIRDRVVKRAAWIVKQKREFELLLPATTPRSYINGESHYYLGKRYRLRAEAGNANEITLGRGWLYVAIREKLSPTRIHSLLDEWYRKQAKTLFTERIALLLEHAHREALPTPRMQIRTMRTRWGSCSPAGLITLNPLLAQVPTECIDYVIAHELCHLQEPHHGSRFWHLLERLMPDYRERREKLQRFSRLVCD